MKYLCLFLIVLSTNLFSYNSIEEYLSDLDKEQDVALTLPSEYRSLENIFCDTWDSRIFQLLFGINGLNTLKKIQATIGSAGNLVYEHDTGLTFTNTSDFSVSDLKKKLEEEKYLGYAPIIDSSVEEETTFVIGCHFIEDSKKVIEQMETKIALTFYGLFPVWKDFVQQWRLSSEFRYIYSEEKRACYAALLNFAALSLEYDFYSIE